jgi:hypothetical protein
VLAQVKKGSDVEIEVQKPGRLVISFSRELARVASIAPYLASSRASDENIFPLRMLLAKHVVERNNGRLTIDQTSDEKDKVTMEFPIV